MTIIKRLVQVGGQLCKVNEQEWIAANLRKGDRVRVTLKDGREFDAAAIGSYFYDGVILRVREADPDELIEHSLFPSFDGTRLAVPSC